MLLNPISANSLFARGELAISESRPRDAIPDIERALRLDPAYSHHYLHYLGVANLLLGNDETAALIFRERLVLAKDTDISRAMLASALGHLGEVEESRKVWKRLMKINPHFSIQERLTRLAFTDPSGGDRIVDGLTKSGLPE